MSQGTWNSKAELERVLSVVSLQHKLDAPRRYQTHPFRWKHIQNHIPQAHPPRSTRTIKHDAPPPFLYLPPGSMDNRPEPCLDYLAEPLDSFQRAPNAVENFEWVDNKTRLTYASSRVLDVAPSEVVTPKQPQSSMSSSDEGRHSCQNASFIEKWNVASLTWRQELFETEARMSTKLRDFVMLLFHKWKDCCEEFDEGGVSFTPSWGPWPWRQGEEQCCCQQIFKYSYMASRFLRVQCCNAPDCNAKRLALEGAMPPGRWEALQDFVLALLSCGVPAILYIFLWFVAGTRKDIVLGNSHPNCPVIIEMNDLLVWASRTVGLGVQYKHDVAGFLVQMHHITRPGYYSRAMTLSEKARNHGICPNRLWNIPMQGDDDVADLCYLATVALEMPMLGLKDRHKSCTADMCLYSHDNSTIIQQLHKCPSRSCRGETYFNPKLLNDVFRQPATSSVSSHVNSNDVPRTAWVIQQSLSKKRWHLPAKLRRRPSLCSDTSKYIALSHVWSDGTGIGMKPAGRVNACLFAYFSDIAARFGCDGIWWDAISIPTARTQRTQAMNKMLLNYEKAAYTIVHDLELVNLEWTDDGRPAVALVLSAWFTRGWTAAELFASRDHDVKVLFKDPNNPNGPPLIKDLEEDILIYPLGSQTTHILSHLEALKTLHAGVTPGVPGWIPPLGHHVASDILRQVLNGNPVGSPASYEWNGGLAFMKDKRDERPVLSYFVHLRDLLRVLRPRTTSWARDRLIIAALMCLPPSELAIDAPGPEITKKILTHFQNMFAYEIIHTQVPIADFGPWSWCPPSIFDLGHSVLRPSRLGTCSFEKGGRIILHDLRIFSVLEDDQIQPVGLQLALAARVFGGLLNRKECLMLAAADESHQPLILAKPVSVKRRTMANYQQITVSCIWVGSVTLEGQQVLAQVTQPFAWSLIRNAADYKPGTRAIWNNLISGGMSMGDIHFEFGADVDEEGEPLGAMSAQSALAIAALGSRLESVYWYSEHCRVLQLTERDSVMTRDRGMDSEYPPNPVCFYHRHPERVTVMRDDSIVYPSAAMKFDFDSAENRISVTFLQGIAKRLGLEVHQCVEAHEYQCEGRVTLDWSFPSTHGGAPSLVPDIEYVRTLFESTFHVVQRAHRFDDFELAVGSSTFTEEIKGLIWPREGGREPEDCIYLLYPLKCAYQVRQHLGNRQPVELEGGFYKQPSSA